MSILPPPMELLNLSRDRFSRFFDEAENLRRASQDEWPDWCYIPMGFSVGYLQYISGGKLNDNLDVGLLTATFIWRLTKGIYRFDGDFASELIKTKNTGAIPVNAFFQLPAYCCYIDTTPFNLNFIGFFVHLEYDVRYPDVPELRFLMVKSDLSIYVRHLPLIGGTIEESVNYLDRNVDSNDPEYKKIKEEEIEQFKSVISIVLALCAPQSIDVQRITPATKKNRNFKATGEPQPIKWDVGVRIGSAIRQYKKKETASVDHNTKTNKTVRPHVRAAHWHTYRSGEGKKDTILKWLSPIIVKSENIDSLDELPAVIREIQH